jgi:hypothetical protein
VTIDQAVLGVLQPVVKMAREELADMESDDIPSGLRKAARSSARTLPPPLARSVVIELIRSDTFRSAVAERYQEGGDVDDDLLAFLDEPGPAMERLAARGAAQTESGTQADLMTAHSAIEKLERQLSEAKRRNAALRTQQTDDLHAARSSISDGQIRAEARLERLTSELSGKQHEVSALEAKVAKLSSELVSSEERLAAVVEKSRKRGDAGVQPGHQYRTDSTPSDPLELASWLDGVERKVRPFRERRISAGSTAAVEPLRIDPGVAPDSASALASLIEQQPLRFLLDGYNIGGEIHAGEFATRMARDDVIQRAGRLARSTEAEVLVVFDGPDDEGRSGFRSSGGVVVRFSRGVKADDVIAALVSSDPTRTVVVTNDRGLRDRCTVDGCVPIWSTAFLEWL